jgi:hypothetical protein
MAPSDGGGPHGKLFSPKMKPYSGSAPKNAQFPPFGTAIGCVFVGLLLAGLAVILYQVGTPDVPRNDIVQISDAKVERAYKRCNRRGLRTCWMMIDIETDGMHRELVQYDTPPARAALEALRPGDTITALVSPVSTLENGLSYWWEIRRADEVLLSYEQTSKDELERNHRNRWSSFSVGGLSAILLVIGAIVGIRKGVWRTAA